MELYLLRHGDAGRSTTIAAGQDSGDLPLTIAGREEIALVARSVRMLNLKISAIVTSPLKRAVQTAKIIARVLAIEKRISIWNELLPESDRSKLYNKRSYSVCLGLIFKILDSQLLQHFIQTMDESSGWG